MPNLNKWIVLLNANIKGIVPNTCAIYIRMRKLFMPDLYELIIMSKAKIMEILNLAEYSKHLLFHQISSPPPYQHIT